MYVDFFDWDEWDDTKSNLRHIVGAGDVTKREVEDVILNHWGPPDDRSDDSKLPISFGTTADGKRIAVVYEDESAGGFVIIRPKTSYPVPEYGG